jgi:pilus assembly protein CpaE
MRSAPSPAATIEAVAAEIPLDEATVILFGPSLATETGLGHALRITRTHPEVGIVLLANELTTPMLQQALRSGVRDAITIDAGERQIRLAIERVGDAMAAIATRSAAAAYTDKVNRGRTIVAFSTNGGVGKSMLATNLAVMLATFRPGRAVLVDADLQFGDVAVLLGVPPTHTTPEAALAVDAADADLMEELLGTHEASSLRVLCAPVEPQAGGMVSAADMGGIVKLLRAMFDYIVIDMPPHFDDVVLALLEEADDVLLVASMDIPSIKNLKVGIRKLDLLSVAGSKLRLVLNRANARVNLDIADLERALRVPAGFRIPSDIAVPQSVNRGVPVVLDKPRSPASTALRAFAEKFITNDVAEQPEQPDSGSTEKRRKRQR